MIVARRIIFSVLRSEGMFDLPVVDAVMRVWAGEDIVEIEDRHVVEGVIIFMQPVVEQPLVEGTCVFGIC